MSDIDFDPPNPDRAVDSSARTSGDGGGGFNFVFYDGNGHPAGGEHGEPEEKKPRDVDFGEPVKVNLSAQARARLDGAPAPEDAARDADAPGTPGRQHDDREHDGGQRDDHDRDDDGDEPPPPADHIGRIINITV